MSWSNLAPLPLNQQQSLRDLQIQGNDNITNVVQGKIVTLTQNKIIQVSVDEIKTREFITTSPYKGLKNFEPEDKDKFFGRHQFLTGLVNELEHTNLVLLLGASGSGKSSVIRAGLIPWLSQKWGNQFMSLMMKPDHDPFESLYSSLLSRGFRQEEAKAVRAGEADALTRLVQTAKQPGAFWFLFIDQFEELFTVSDPKKRDRFIQGLAKLCKDHANDPTLKIVATLRADFLDRLDAEPANRLAQLTEKHRPLMTQMQPDELRLAIEQPAAHHGVVFETGLVEMIIKDVQGQAGYLPLLQYTLDLLWQDEVRDGDINDRTLNITSYKDIGGVRGALQQRVNQIYQRLSAAEQTATQRIFLKLVGIGGDSTTEADWKPVRKRELRSRFDDDLEKKVLAQLIDANLLVSDGADSKATVEIAHEILLTSWNRLKQWITENREAIALRNRLNEDVAQWKVTKLDDELWSGTKLAKAVDLQNDVTFNPVLGGFSPDVTEFIEASVGLRDKLARKEEARRKRELERERKARKTAQRVTAGVAIGGVLMAGLALFSGTKVREAKIQQIETSVALSEANLANNQHLEADIESIRAARILTKPWWKIAISNSQRRATVLKQLQSASLSGDEVNRLMGHKDPITSLAYSHNSQLIAASGKDGTTRLWDTTGKPLAVLEGHDGSVREVVFSPDGHRLATAGADGTVRVWTIAGEELAILKGHDGTVWEITFDSSGERLATHGADGTVRVWDIEKEQSTILKGHDGTVLEVVFSPDGQRLATAGEDGTARVWDIDGTELAVLKGHAEALRDVAFGFDGQRLATASEDGTARLWNIEDQQSIELKGHGGQVTDVAFNPVEKELATSGSDGTIRRWDFDGRQLAALEAHDGPARGVTFSQNGQRLATYGETDGTVHVWDIPGQRREVFRGDGDISDVEFIDPTGERFAASGADGTVRLWDFDGQQPPVFEGHEGKVLRVAFSPDGQRLATSGQDGTARVWSHKGKELKTLEGHDSVHGGWTVEFSPNGHQLVAGGASGPARVWFLESGEKRFVELEGHDGSYINDVVLSPDGQWIATSGDDGTAQLWTLDGDLVAVLEGHDGRVNHVAFSSDSKQLATAGEDGTARLWTLNGELVTLLVGHSKPIREVQFSPIDRQKLVTNGKDGIAVVWDIGNRSTVLKGHIGPVWEAVFSPDGQHILTRGDDGTARLWTLDGRPLKTLEGHERPVKEAIFSPKGQRIATRGDDGTARVWDLDGNQLAIFAGHGDYISDVKFSPDGQQLATSGHDGTARLWPIEEFDELLARQCDWVRDYLENNPDVDEGDRHLCDGIGSNKEPDPAQTPTAKAPAAAAPPAESAAPSASELPAFFWAVEHANWASDLTQTAQTPDEWTNVANHWQKAIALMRAVPETDPDYAIAQQKVGEYQENLQYAKERTAYNQ